MKCEVFKTSCVDGPGPGISNKAMHDEGVGDSLLIRCWELEEGTGQIEDVQGRLKSCLAFWEKELDPAPWIVSCI